MIGKPAGLAMLGVLAAITPGAGFSQALPADCSAATVPAQPVEISILGARFTPKSIKLRSAGGITSGDEKFDTYYLTLRSEDSLFAPLEAEVAVIVRAGQRPDGKVFRKLPVKDTAKQPSPTEGLPEVQGWSFKNRKAQADLSHVSYIGSLRLEFGQRKGNAIGGKIYLCAAKGQTSMFEKTPTKEDSSAIGTFEATIDK